MNYKTLVQVSSNFSIVLILLICTFALLDRKQILKIPESKELEELSAVLALSSIMVLLILFTDRVKKILSAES